MRFDVRLPPPAPLLRLSFPVRFVDGSEFGVTGLLFPCLSFPWASEACRCGAGSCDVGGARRRGAWRGGAWLAPSSCGHHVSNPAPLRYPVISSFAVLPSGCPSPAARNDIGPPTTAAAAPSIYRPAHHYNSRSHLKYSSLHSTCTGHVLDSAVVCRVFV